MSTAVYVQLTDILRRVFNHNDITISPETTAADIIGWDSFKHVEIVLELEEHYGIELPIGAVNRARNVGQLVSLVESKIQQE